MNIEDLIEKKGIYADKAYAALDYSQLTKVVPDKDLREFMKGRVVVDAEAFKWVLRACPMDVDALKYSALIEQALHAEEVKP